MPGYNETMLRGMQQIVPQFVQQRRLQDMEGQQQFERQLRMQQLQRQYEVMAQGERTKQLQMQMQQENQRRLWEGMRRTDSQREVSNDLARKRLEATLQAQAQPHFGEVKNVLTPSGDALPTSMNTKTGRLHDLRTGQPMALGEQDTLQKLEPLSSKELEGLRENADELTQAVRAYGMLRGKTVEGVKGDPTATGWEGWLPNIVRQVPGVYQATGGKSGAMTRAAIENLGGIIRKERSGTAVSGSEMAKLAPYLPNDYDDEDVAREKLSGFIREFRGLLNSKMEMFQRSGRPIPKALRSYVDKRITDSVAGTKNAKFLSQEEKSALDLIYQGGGRGTP